MKTPCQSKMEELEQPEEKRSRSSLQVSTAPSQPKDPPTILEFAASTLRRSGLYIDEEKVVLYCRENVKALFRFLFGVLYTFTPVVSNENNPYQLGWILGPPGVGKSLAVFAFTRSPEVSEWAVTWIHCLRKTQFRVCHRDKTVEVTKTLNSEQSLEYLNQLKVKNHHLLVLDGFTNKTASAMQEGSEAWLEADFEKRRLVVICSMAFRGKSSNKSRDLTLRVTECNVSSWTLEEYKAALREPVLCDAVKKGLGTEAARSTDEVVESKHYFAGGSARYMFQMTTDKVKEDLDKAIEAVPDMQTFSAAITGSSSTGFVHCLSFIQDEMRGIVSQYAGNRLAVKLGTRLVEHCLDLYELELSPPMNGFLFEMWFFAKLSKEGINLRRMDGGLHTWKPSKPVHMPSEDEKRFPRTWFQAGWNDGGFDAVYVDPQYKTVSFVQITLNNHHSFKIEFFSKFLDRLNMHTEKVVIYFVYPEGASHEKPVTTGQGLLSLFQWKKGEEWNKVTKVTLDWPGR